MARKTVSTTQTHERQKTAKATETRRIKSLEPKGGKQLTSLEEAVVRMHHGVSVKANAKLPTNGVNDEVMTQLFEMEVRAHVESGRIEELPDVPKGARSARTNAKTQKVVDKLKKKR
jgi:hypothetical protein